MLITGNDLERIQREGQWQRPPQRNDLDTLDELFACFKVPDFCCRIPGAFIECIIGEPLELYCPARARTKKVTLTRSPKGSKNQLSADGIRLIPDVQGLYSLQLSINDYWTRVVHVAAFPREVEKRLQIDDPKQAFKRRMRLRQIVWDKRVTPETVIDSLEGDDPMLGMGGRIVGGGRPLPPGSSVNGATSTAFSVQNYCSQ